MAKLEAYELQDACLDTVEANHALGFKADCRDFSLPAAILRDLGIKRVRLLSNNTPNADALAANGIGVVAQLTCEAQPNPHSFAYLRTKKEKMGHALSLLQGDGRQFAKKPLAECSTDKLNPRRTQRNTRPVAQQPDRSD
jgi:GTP cyclohydrolase II